MKNLLLLCSILLLHQLSYAQSNPGFNYQAVARDANGQVMKNQQLDLRFSIILDNSGVGNGAIIYREKHLPTTNEYGLFSTIVGQGDSLFGDFQKIDWEQSNLFLQVDIDLDLDQQYTFMGKTKILPVPLALHALSVENVDDADADPKNEIQVIGFDAATGVLQLSNGGGQVDLSSLKSNGTGTDDQTITLNGSILSIEDGNSVDFSAFLSSDPDQDPQNEIQQLTFDTTTFLLSLSNGGQVDLSTLKTSGGQGVLQNLSLNGSNLAITGGNTIDLSGLPDAVDDADADPQNEIQALSLDTATNILSLSNGGQIDLAKYTTDNTADADADPQNELQAISFDTTTNILTLSNGGQVDLTTLKASGGQGILQNLNLNGSNLAITGGNTIDLSGLPDAVDDADADPQNEIQALSLDTATNILSLSNGGQIDLAKYTTDNTADADADPQNELQAISFDTTTNILTLSNGGQVDLTTLKASGGQGILQNLNLNGSNLAITGGNTIDLSGLPDAVDDADADPQNEIQALSLDTATNILSLSNGGQIDLAKYTTDNTADADADPQNELQAISFDTTTNILTLSNGGQVDLTTLKTSGGQGILQNLSLNGTDLSISGGNTIDLSILGSGSSPWNLIGDTVSYTNGPTEVGELFIKNGDSVFYLFEDFLFFDFDKNTFGDGLYLGNNGFEYSPMGENYVKLTEDSLYLQNSDLRASNTFSATNISLVDPLKKTDLDIDGLKFEFNPASGNNAYYGHDSLSFAANLTTLLPAFSDMNAYQLNFYTFAGRSLHEAGYSQYSFAQDTLDITAFGLVNRGLSANTPYERFRLEANNFTMYNDQRFKSYEFINPNGASSTQFNMYPGTGLPAYFQVQADPLDGLNPQVSLNYAGSIAAQLTTEIGGYGRLNLFDPNGFGLAEVSALNGIYYQDSLGYGFSMGPTGINKRQEFQIYNGDALVVDTVGNIKWKWTPTQLIGLRADNGLMALSVGTFTNTNESYIGLFNGDLSIYADNPDPITQIISQPLTRLTKDSRIILNNPNTSFNGLQMSHSDLKIFDSNGGGLNPAISMSEASGTPIFQIYHPDASAPNISLSTNSVGEGSISLRKRDGNVAISQSVNQSGIPVLAVHDGKYELYNHIKDIKAQLEVVEQTGRLRLYGSNGNMNVELGTSGFTNLGYVSTRNDQGTTTAQMGSFLTGGLMSVNRDDGQVMLNNYVTTSLSGRQETYGSNLTLNTVVGANENFEDRGGIAVYDNFGVLKAAMYVDEFGLGQIIGDTKNFVVDHPKDESKEIWYVSLEGPEAAMYERGTAELKNGEAFIPFSESFQLLANEESMTVLVTPLSAESTGLAVVKKTLAGVYVKELFKGQGTYTFDWEVKAVRKGHENHQVIRDKK